MARAAYHSTHVLSGPDHARTNSRRSFLKRGISLLLADALIDLGLDSPIWVSNGQHGAKITTEDGRALEVFIALGSVGQGNKATLTLYGGGKSPGRTAVAREDKFQKYQWGLEQPKLVSEMQAMADYGSAAILC